MERNFHPIIYIYIMNSSPIFTPDSKAELQEALNATGGMPTLLAFVMEGCPACTQLKQSVGSSGVQVVLLDIDKFRSLATTNAISRVPTYYMVRYVNGELRSSSPPQIGGDPGAMAESIQTSG